MIPQFEEIRIQALKELSAGIVMRAKDLRIPLAKHFGLTDEEMNAWYPSGNGEIFLDRISWALSYLFIAGLVEKPQRGDYKISEKGLSMLSSCTEKQIRWFWGQICQLYYEVFGRFCIAFHLVLCLCLYCWLLLQD